MMKRYFGLALLASLLLAGAMGAAQEDEGEKLAPPSLEESEARPPIPRNDPAGSPPGNERRPEASRPRPHFGQPGGMPGVGPGGLMPGMPGQGFPGMQEPDGKLAELTRADEQFEHMGRQLAQHFRMANQEQREELKAKLTEVLNKHFEIRQQRRELQIKRMEAELQRQRETIKKRAEARDEIIQKRLSELTGEQSDLEF